MATPIKTQNNQTPLFEYRWYSYKYSRQILEVYSRYVHQQHWYAEEAGPERMGPFPTLDRWVYLQVLREIVDRRRGRRIGGRRGRRGRRRGRRGWKRRRGRKIQRRGRRRRRLDQASKRRRRGGRRHGRPPTPASATPASATRTIDPSIKPIGGLGGALPLRGGSIGGRL